ncbi:MAG: hypothetical protein AB7F28_03190 [Candidatus Margulisiibacteriota bacterium]
MDIAPIGQQPFLPYLQQASNVQEPKHVSENHKPDPIHLEELHEIHNAPLPEGVQKADVEHASVTVKELQTNIESQLKSINAHKNDPSTQSQLQAVQGYKGLATQHQSMAIIGLLSMMQGRGQDPFVTAEIMNTLIPFFNTENYHLLESMLITLGRNLDAVRGPYKEQVQQALQNALATLNLTNHPEPAVRLAAIQLLNALEETGVIPAAILAPEIPAEAAAEQPVFAEGFVPAQAQRTPSTVPADPAQNAYAASAMATMAWGSFFARVFAFYPLLDMSPSLIYALLYVAGLGSGGSRSAYAKNSKTVAIITTRSASLPRGQFDFPGIEVVEMGPELSEKNFRTKYHALLTKGIQTIYVILPDSRYWNIYHNAFSASDNRPNIRVFDSRTFGIGMALVVRQLGKALIRTNSGRQMDFFIRSFAKVVRYWVVLDSFDQVKNHAWFGKLLGKPLGKSSFDVHNIVMQFHEPSGIVGKEPTLIKGLSYVKKELQLDCIHRQKEPRKIFIQHHERSKEATMLADALRKKYPNLNIQVFPSSDYLASQLGCHVGVAML